MMFGGHSNEAGDLHGQPSNQWREGQMSEFRRLHCSHKTLIRRNDRDGRVTGLLVSPAGPVLQSIYSWSAAKGDMSTS